MKAKYKATELLENFMNTIYLNIKGEKIDGLSLDVIAKECALIACDEILNASITKDNYIYWTNVKHQIHQL